MGLLSGFKELFNKNIECGEDLDSHILVFLKGKKYLYLGKNIIVRDNSACVVVYRNRVCDVLLPGKYKIGQDVIPECYSRAKIEKLKSKGRNLKKIRVKLYYVNTTEFKDFNFTSNMPFSIKSKELGKVKGCLCGKCTLRVIDSALFIKYLISSSRKINESIAIEKISSLIGNKMNKIFEKCKIPFEMMFTDREKVNSILNTEMEDALDKRGVFVKNISLKSVDIAKKHQEKVNEYVASYKRIVTPNTSQKIWGIGDEFKIPIKTVINNFNEEASTCSKCGHKNSNSNRVCGNCGNKLNSN